MLIRHWMRMDVLIITCQHLFHFWQDDAAVAARCMKSCQVRTLGSHAYCHHSSTQQQLQAGMPLRSHVAHYTASITCISSSQGVAVAP
jgi:hypothetical protein